MTPRKNGFLCYAHAGGASPSRKYVLELQKHLKQVHAGEEQEAWCDQNIEAGEDWLAKIHAALAQAAYAVLFINIEFLESRFITEIELPRLLAAAQRDGLLLIPLRISDCLLPDWLERIQFLNYGRPLASPSMRRANRDSIYTAVARRVKDHLDADTGGYAPISQMAGESRQAMGDAGTAVGLPATGMVVESTARAEARDLADALSQALADRLEQIRERHRRGERAQAGEEIGRLIEHAHWSALDESLRGRILRTAALYRLVDGPDIDAARALAERAVAEVDSTVAVGRAKAQHCPTSMTSGTFVPDYRASGNTCAIGSLGRTRSLPWVRLFVPLLPGLNEKLPHGSITL